MSHEIENNERVTTQMGKREDKEAQQKRENLKQNPQKLFAPDLPVYDELGMEAYEFKCWRCARPDYREKNSAEAILQNGKKLFCTACDRPDLYEWDVETLADGTKREFLRPLTEREMYKRISPEAHMLAAKQALVQTLRARREAILRMTSQLEVEYHGLIDAIKTAEADMIEAEKLCSMMEKDDVGRKIESAQELQAKVMRLVKEIEDAKKQLGQGQQATGGK